MTKIIAVIGSSASGKSFICDEINTGTKNLSYLSIDTYYLPKDKQKTDENGVPNYDLPGSINNDLFLEHVKQLESGSAVELEEYMFEKVDAKGSKFVIEPTDFLLIESLFLLHDKRIRKLIDYSIFIDTPLPVCLKRRLSRDTTEREVSEEMVKYQWENHILPSFNKYIKPYKSEVDLIIDGNRDKQIVINDTIRSLKKQFPNLIFKQ